MGNIVKLANVGDSATWRIAGCETVAGKFGAQVKFTNDGGDMMFLSQDTADRQLDRCGLTTATAIGETLVFFRSENAKGGAPYWNIKVAGAADKQPPSKRLNYAEAASGPSRGSIPEMDNFPDEEYGRSVQSPSGPADDEPYASTGKAPTPHRVPSVPPVAPVATEKAKIVRAYLDLFAWMRTQPEVTDVPLDVVQSISATVWIEWNRRGLTK